MKLIRMFNFGLVFGKAVAIVRAKRSACHTFILSSGKGRSKSIGPLVGSELMDAQP